MKVNNSNIPESSALGVGKAQQTDATSQSSRSNRGGAASHGGAADSVQMSSLASVLGGESASRAERVEQLASLVQSGEYSVDSQTLSKAIVKSTLNGLD